MAIKIVISPSFGGGFSTDSYNFSREEKFKMITYPPLIEAIERGEDVYPIIEQLSQEIGKRISLYRNDLVIREVKGMFRINEYDGAESVEFFNSDDWWEV